jgi:two-component system chemotaxis sensor kinase CheA
VLAALDRVQSILAGEAGDRAQDGDLPAPPQFQPIGLLWATLPALVRHLAAALGKKIDLRIEGAETALDRRTLALIKDPLIHLVRNSADHGLESPAERAAAGKPETGTLSLRAYRERAHIVIEIDDDGRGLQIEAIARKAQSLGLASRTAVAGMSEAEICAFIFMPGFSTAAAVTRVSGRGIGLDAVRDAVETIGGTIELRTRRDAGTGFVIRLPCAIGAPRRRPAPQSVAAH